MRQFLEDYDDRRDDQAFFKGAQLERRLKIREKEIEADTKDRAREREELEELKKRLAEKGLHEDVEAEARRVIFLFVKSLNMILFTVYFINFKLMFIDSK